MTKTQTQIDEVNRVLDKFRGICRHPKENNSCPPYKEFPVDKFQCSHCKEWIHAESFNGKLADYCSEDSPRSLLNAVEAKFDFDQRWHYARNVYRKIKSTRILHKDIGNIDFLTVSTPIRAFACADVVIEWIGRGRNEI